MGAGGEDGLSRSRGALAALALLLCCIGCDEGPEPGTLRGDAEALRRVLERDPTMSVLEEVERKADDGERRAAAELLEGSALPAARRQLERLEQTELATLRVRRLRDRTARAYRDRISALEGYGEVLEAAEPEPQALLRSLRRQRQAEEAVLEVLDRLDGLAGKTGRGAGAGPSR